MSDSIKLIQPVEVKRDENGYWDHPDIPDFDENVTAYKKWKDDQGLQTVFFQLEEEPETHPVYRSYYGELGASSVGEGGNDLMGGDGNISAWELKKPEGEGWFLLYICDTEDGPIQVFGRRADTTGK